MPRGSARDPFDIEATIGGMIRDQYQGVPTIMTAISGVEIAMWDLIGKACRATGLSADRRPMSRSHPNLCQWLVRRRRTPAEFAERARQPWSTAGTARSSSTLSERRGSRSIPSEADRAIDIVAAVRKAVGPRVDLMIEFHGRLAAGAACAMIRRLEPFDPAWCEEPVAPECLDLLAEVKRSATCPIAAGERLYTLADFYRLTALRAADVVQMDLAIAAESPPVRRSQRWPRLKTFRLRRTARSAPWPWRRACTLT